jgi:hypothetical protein
MSGKILLKYMLQKQVMCREVISSCRKSDGGDRDNADIASDFVTRCQLQRVNGVTL